MKNNKGTVFVTSLLLMLVISTLAAITYSVTANTNRYRARNQQKERASSVLEAQIEYGYGIWLSRVASGGSPMNGDAANLNADNQPITSDTNFLAFVDQIYQPAEPQYPQLKITALDEYGVALSGTLPPVGVKSKIEGYTGWKGFTYSYRAEAETLAVKGDPATGMKISRLFEYSKIPLFQATIFTNDNLELTRPPGMILNGLIVHTNKSAYIGYTDEVGVLKLAANLSYVDHYKVDYSCKADWDVYGKGFLSPDMILKAPQYVGGAIKYKREPIYPLGQNIADALNSSEYAGNPNVQGKYHELIEVVHPVTAYEDPLSSKRLSSNASIVIKIPVDQNYQVDTAKIDVTDATGGTLLPSVVTAIRGAVSDSASVIFDENQRCYVAIVDIDIKKILDQNSKIEKNNGVVYAYTVPASYVQGATGYGSPKFDGIQRGVITQVLDDFYVDYYATPPKTSITEPDEREQQTQKTTISGFSYFTESNGNPATSATATLTSGSIPPIATANVFYGTYKNNERVVFIQPIDAGIPSDYTYKISGDVLVKSGYPNFEFSGSSGVKVTGLPAVTGTDSSGTIRCVSALRIYNADNITQSQGMTFATRDPLYIKGNVNSVDHDKNKYPFAVCADAVTILSSAWNDNNSRTTPEQVPYGYDYADENKIGQNIFGWRYWGKRAVPTVCNLAILSGNTPTPAAPDSDTRWSGGIQNLARLLEQWDDQTVDIYGGLLQATPSELVSRIDFTFSGSLVCLFESQVFTSPMLSIGEGQNEVAFSPPRRDLVF